VPPEFKFGKKKTTYFLLQGAGDAFLGALAYFLAVRPDLSLEEQTRRACEYATLSVQKPGTQISYPDKESVPKSLLE